MIVCISVCLFLVILLFQIISSTHAPSFSFRRTCVFPLLSAYYPKHKVYAKVAHKSDANTHSNSKSHQVYIDMYYRVPRSVWRNNLSPIYVISKACVWIGHLFLFATAGNTARVLRRKKTFCRRGFCFLVLGVVRQTVGDWNINVQKATII